MIKYPAFMLQRININNRCTTYYYDQNGNQFYHENWDKSYLTLPTFFYLLQKAKNNDLEMVISARFYRVINNESGYALLYSWEKEKDSNDI